ARPPASPAFGWHEDSGAAAAGSKPHENGKPGNQFSGCEPEQTTSKTYQAQESQGVMPRLVLPPGQYMHRGSVHRPNTPHIRQAKARPSLPVLFWPARVAVAALQKPEPPWSR